MVVKRDTYLNKLIGKKHNGLIKVVTGVRRCGKSYLRFNLFKEHLLSEGVDKNHIIEIAFDAFENKQYQDPYVLMPYLKNQENITYIDSNTGLYEFFQALLPEFVNRNKWKKEKMQSGISDEELYQEMRRFQTKCFLIPDMASFVEHVKNPGEAGNAKAFIENLLDKGSMHNVYWFACLQPDDVNRLGGTRMYDLFIRYKTGMHFGGNVSAQRIFNFDYIPYNEQSKALKTGIGLVPSQEEETVHKVVIPLVKG